MSDEEIVELWNERSAIMEFDGEMSRQSAERRAYVLIRAEIGRNMPDETAFWRPGERRN